MSPYCYIGNVVREQYVKGIYRIAEWAHLVTVHSVPGPGILKGLRDGSQSIGMPRGALLLAEMSTEQNLASGTYTLESIKMADSYRDFVAGFICQRRYNNSNDPNADGYVYMTPGVSFNVKGDSLGQNYNDPESVILNQCSDVIIVGRGILGFRDPVKIAIVYRDIAWEAYMKRCT